MVVPLSEEQRNIIKAKPMGRKVAPWQVSTNPAFMWPACATII